MISAFKPIPVAPSAAGMFPYRPDIDGLRAIAVLLVVAFHYFPNHVPSGFIGVDVFFVISGYLITSIVLGQLESARWTYAHFYERRVLRIFPALLVVLLANLAFGWFALLSDEFAALGKHVAASAVFASNFALWEEAGYFDAAAETKLLLHLWSLAIEEQFYLVWPVLLALSLRGRRHFVATVGAFAVVSFAAGAYASLHHPAAAYYSPLSRGWQLAAGGLLAYAHGRGLSRVPSRGTWLSLGGAALLAAGVATIDRSRIYPGAWALLPTLGTVALIAAGPAAWPNRGLLALRALVWVGLISYPLYLWHWPLLVWGRLLHMADNLPATWRIGLILASGVLATLTYALVEKPLRRRFGHRTVIALCLALALAGIAGALAWARVVDSRMGGAAAQRIVQAAQDWDYPPANFEPIVRFADYNFYRRAGRGPGTTLFVGDSNLEQYAPRIDEVIARDPRASSAILATKGGCPFAVPLLAQRTSDCAAKLVEVERLLASQDVDTVVFVQAWKNLAEIESDEAVAASFEARLASLHGKRVFVILNMPSGLEFGPASLLRGSRLDRLEYRAQEARPRPAEIVRAPLAALNARILLAAARNGATVLDPIDTLCPGGLCPIVDEAGVPLYKDSAHLTATHARRAAGFIDVALLPP